MVVKDYELGTLRPPVPGAGWEVQYGRPPEELKFHMDRQRERQRSESFGSRSSGVWVFRFQSREDLQRRLDNVNRHFRRQAAAVFNDDDALNLLATLYESVVVATEDFNFCRDGRALAKLAAANFAEVGANGIFITESGQRFIENINAQ